jgi:hypothetical protein
VYFCRDTTHGRMLAWRSGQGNVRRLPGTTCYNRLELQFNVEVSRRLE